MHLGAGVGRQAADGEVGEGRVRVGAATFPLADHVVALAEQFCRTPEVEVGEGLAERGGESPDLVTPWHGSVKRIRETDVRGGELVDHARVEVLSQNSVNQRPTMALFSSTDMYVLLVVYAARSDRHRVDAPGWLREVYL